MQFHCTETCGGGHPQVGEFHVPINFSIQVDATSYWTQDSSRVFKEAPPTALKAAGEASLKKCSHVLAQMIWLLDF